MEIPGFVPLVRGLGVPAADFFEISIGRADSTAFCSPLTIYRPYPGDDFPEVVICLDDFPEVRHRSYDALGALTLVTQLPERIAGT